MREFFRRHRNNQTMRASVFALAKLAHEAEDADDDLLLLAVTDEMESRERELPGSQYMYHQEYMRLMANRRRTAHTETPPLLSGAVDRPGVLPGDPDV